MRKRTFLEFIKGFAILFWLSFLTKSDAFYSPYLITGITGVICYLVNSQSDGKDIYVQHKKVRLFFSGTLSILICLANYKNYLIIDDELNFSTGFNSFLYWSTAFLCFIGGLVVFNEIIKTIGLKTYKSFKRNRVVSKTSFIIPFIILSVTNLFILISANYPGVVSPDSWNQLWQVCSKVYSNHHPYYHTRVIGIWIALGNKLGGNINLGIALYSSFSVILMAAIFSYCIYSMHKICDNKVALLVAFLYYLFMPFHIVYSFTMWKDVMWSGAVAAFSVGLYIYSNSDEKNKIVDFAVLVITAFVIALFRGNGVFVLVMSVIIYSALFFKEQKIIIATFIMIIISSLVLKGPVLDSLGVMETETVESLSVPAQQISRVIAEGATISDEDRSLLEKVVDIDKVPEYYTCWLADSIKGLIRDKGNQNYIREHALDYLKLYIKLGMKYPDYYIKAWIDQTKGYFNSGYAYWHWGTGIADNSNGMQYPWTNLYGTGICENDLDIKGTSFMPSVRDIFFLYLWLFENVPLLQVFLSVGFHVWILLLALVAGIYSGNKSKLFIPIPSIMVIISLLIATPVYAEFRYAYSLFCILPFIIISFIGISNNEKKLSD